MAPSAQATESVPTHPNSSRLTIDANQDHGAIAAVIAMGPQAMTGQLAGKRILIVKDEPMIAENLADQMTIEGAEVIGPVATAEAALDAISVTHPDGATLDIKLMGKKTFQGADALVARHIPFVFLTG
jgi:hypothetical protein